MPEPRPTTGVPELDRVIGGLLPGDNVVWEEDSGTPVESIVSRFIGACETDGLPLVYVSFNAYVPLMSKGRFRLVDCFSAGKGNNDAVFVDYLKSASATSGIIKVDNPGDPAALQAVLLGPGLHAKDTRYVFDSLTGMLDMWRDEEQVLRLFGHICPRLFDLNTIAYWLLEKGAHSLRALAKIQHITQVVVETEIAKGGHTLTVRKAANRACPEIGVPQRISVEDGNLVVHAVSREDRELALLTAMGEALNSALEPNAFFERTMEAVARELGMVRGTLVLLDRISGKLRIVAAHGLTEAERRRGEYAVGEGITGAVVQSGKAEVVPDIHEDSRFLDRTAARKSEEGRPVGFICVPLKVDGESVGAISVDRPFASRAALEKDLRLMNVVAMTVSQVLKINRLVQVEKEEILVRDEKVLGEMRERYRLGNVIGQSASIRKVLATAVAAAKSDAPILITGDTGTGKELIANVIHFSSSRSAGPLVRINCGALPEDLLESELFGHVRGAFTGAVRDRKGRFELADHGTLFLDEVADMSTRLQVKLLRVLESMEFEPVGGTQTIRVDVRVVAATNKDLRKQVRDGVFRHDLYYRMNVIPLRLPPLKERRDDIPLLVDHFMEVYGRKNRKKVTKLSREVLDLLLAYPWPGNIRELENTVERAVVMSPGDSITPDVLPAEVVDFRTTGRAGVQDAESAAEEFRRTVDAALGPIADLGGALRDLTAVVEERVLRRAVESGVNQRVLADVLGMSRMTLRKKLRRFGIG
jgi:Nif-specific regulatory protein